MRKKRNIEMKCEANVFDLENNWHLQWQLIIMLWYCWCHDSLVNAHVRTCSCLLPSFTGLVSYTEVQGGRHAG